MATDVKQELTATGWQGARYGFIWGFGQINENEGNELNSKLLLSFISVSLAHPTSLCLNSAYVAEMYNINGTLNLLYLS